MREDDCIINWTDDFIKLFAHAHKMCTGLCISKTSVKTKTASTCLLYAHAYQEEFIIESAQTQLY